MKRSVLLLFLIILVLTSCSNDFVAPYEGASPNGTVAEAALDSESLAVTVIESGQQEPTDESSVSIEFLWPESSLLREDILYDFDFMMKWMEETFPFFGVLERRFGLDVRELARDTREIIEHYPYSLSEFAAQLGLAKDDLPPLDANVFWGILQGEFFRHFGVYVHGDAPPADWTHLVLRTPRSEISAEFYRDKPQIERLIFQYSQELHEFTFRSAQLRGSNYILELTPDGRFPPNMTREILVEDYIAYIRIRTFNFDLMELRRQATLLNRFYREIQDLSHLIIDIRGAPGGRNLVSYQLIMEPLSRGMEGLSDVPMYVFYRRGDLGHIMASENFYAQKMGHNYIFVESDRLMTVYDLMDSSPLLNLNENDIDELAYGFRMNISLENNIMSMPLGFGNYPFGGQIWLLIDEGNFSHAAHFAFEAKGSGFATLVGSPVGGSFTHDHALQIELPNSGIIVQWDTNYLTDAYGRALNEFPTEPHYFNRPGMDALETVLAIIEER